MIGNAGPNSEYEFQRVLGQMRNKTGNARINVIPKRVLESTATAQKQHVFTHSEGVFGARKAHAPYWYLWPVRLYDIFS